MAKGKARPAGERRLKLTAGGEPPPEVAAAIIAAIDEYMLAEGRSTEGTAGLSDDAGDLRGSGWRVSINPGRPTPGAEVRPRADWSAAGRRGLMQSGMRMDWRKGSGR
ncbi:MAG TPA: hypothetical protein VGL40_10065 [Bacillota bacterium]|jgi:hypothetical protein